MEISEVSKRLKANRAVLASYWPKTKEERLAKLKERMDQAWPTFGETGLYSEWNLLYISDRVPGTMVRFFTDGVPTTFDTLGAVRHGPYWFLSETVEGRDYMTDTQMRSYLEINKLNWVVVQ